MEIRRHMREISTEQNEVRVVVYVPLPLYDVGHVLELHWKAMKPDHLLLVKSSVKSDNLFEIILLFWRETRLLFWY